MREWERDELEEQISQAVTLLKKLLLYSDDCEIRTTCENWIEEHRAYLPVEARGYDISEVDADNLPF